MKIEILARAQGCMMGQLVGDALGGLVEFQSPTQIAGAIHRAFEKMKDGGTFNTIAGQPTDDSEMALSLARSVIGSKGYSPVHAKASYVAWLDSRPFDCGNTHTPGVTRHC